MEKTKQIEELADNLIDRLIDLGTHEITAIFVIGNLRSINSLMEMKGYISTLNEKNVTDSMLFKKSREIRKKYGELKNDATKHEETGDFREKVYLEMIVQGVPESTARILVLGMRKMQTLQMMMDFMVSIRFKEITLVQLIDEATRICELNGERFLQS